MKFLMYRYIFNFLFKQIICDANKFGFIIISSKCRFNEQVLRNCIGVNSF